eukprot:XP_001707247.1 Hypothetical protein GL50803_114429 [Giardia lamblia ATCC 50803]
MSLSHLYNNEKLLFFLIQVSCHSEQGIMRYQVLSLDFFETMFYLDIFMLKVFVLQS